MTCTDADLPVHRTERTSPMGINRNLNLGSALCSVLLASACGDPMSVGSLNQAKIYGNTLIPNTLIPNSLDPNALNPNTLNHNTLNPNTLSPDSMRSLLDPSMYGDMSRSLVRYLVGCALAPSSVFSFSWTDNYGTTHEETYPGILSLAPEWATQPLDSGHEAIISACVASRVNYYGIPVEISSRAPVTALSSLDAAERTAYNKIEGAFWGNLFNEEQPWVHACGIGANAANSRAWKRDCAAGHPDGNGGTEACGIMDIVGDCDDVCDHMAPEDDYFGRCTDPQNGAQTQVITTALPPAANAGAPVNLALTSTAPTSVVTQSCTAITFYSTVTNTGTETAVAPVFTDSLPVAVTVESITSSSGTCTNMGGVVTCHLPDLGAGQSATITITASALQTDQTIMNFVSVGTASVESDLADNSDVISTQLVRPSGTWEQAAAAFNSTAIAEGSTVWFSTVLDLPESSPEGTVWSDGGTISFQANGVTYQIPMPAAKVVVANSATAGTSFDGVHHRWQTTVPTAVSGNVFLSGVAWRAPANLPGGIQNVTVSTRLSATQANLAAGWSWGAAVYSSFDRDYGTMQIVPTDAAAYNPFNNSHPAGSPEVDLGSLVAGARSLGQGDYVGTRTTAATGTFASASCQ